MNAIFRHMTGEELLLLRILGGVPAGAIDAELDRRALQPPDRRNRPEAAADIEGGARLGAKRAAPPKPHRRAA